MHLPPGHLLLASAPTVAVAKIPLNPYTVAFLIIGLVFAGWLVVMAMFYGRKSDHSTTDAATQSAPASSRTGADHR